MPARLLFHGVRLSRKRQGSVSDPTKIPSWLEGKSEAVPPRREELLPMQKSSSSSLPQRRKAGLRPRGLLEASVLQKVWEERKKALADWKPVAPSKVTLRNLAIYTRQLGLMLGSGLNPAKAFEILGTQGEEPRLRKASLQVKDDLISGKSLSQAMGAHSAIFPALMQFTVQSAEATGTLPEALLRLSAYYEKENLRFQKLRASLVYPAFVFTFAVIMFFIMLGYIFPLFDQFFAGLNFQLPPLTRFLFALFNFLTSRWFWIGAGVGLVLLYFGLRAGLKNRDFVLRLNMFFFQLPVIGTLIKESTASYLCRSFATMLGAGVFLIAAFQILRKGTPNILFKVLLYFMEEDVRGGMSLASTFQASSLFPRIVEDMVLVGEESGKLESMLSKAADFLDLEVEYLLQNLTALIEPALILALGIMVGTILIGVFLPLYSAISQIH
jgi:type IV pilus assembly protein PilC